MSVASTTKKIKAITSTKIRKFDFQTRGDPDLLHSDCSPADLAAWFVKCRTWFTIAAPTPIPLHRHQLMNCIRLKLDKGWESELKYLIDWDRDLIDELEKVMKQI